MAENIVRCQDCIWWDYKKALEDPQLRYQPVGLCTRSDSRAKGFFTNFYFYCGCGEINMNKECEENDRA